MTVTDVTATILAAGVGSRLRPLTDAVPKCLVPVAGRPILAWQLEAMAAAGIAETVVVAGYRAADVVAFCRAYGPAVRVVVNEAYDRTNNMYSLRLGLEGRRERPMIVSNGDVVFDAAILAGLVAGGAADAIAVEPGRYIEESMKVEVAGGRITALSKAIPVTRAYGVSIDLYRFSPRGLAAVLGAADRLIDAEGRTNLWTEVAIEAALPEVFVHPHDIQGRPWIEVDNHDDLAEGERLFGRVSA